MFKNLYIMELTVKLTRKIDAGNVLLLTFEPGINIPVKQDVFDTFKVNKTYTITIAPVEAQK